MTFEEKGTWIQAVMVLGVAVVYGWIVMGRAQDAPVEDIAYQAPMLWCIGISVVVSILATIVAAVANPEEADKKDERDREIHRTGEYFGQYLLVLGAVAALGLAMTEQAHFWIAQALFAGFVLQGITSAVVKIRAYRRGL